jgi:enamine deaminase RidA (YjgF/YER057c/UK114 family)
VIERLNPPRLHRTAGYHHVTIVETGRTAYLAGQCPVTTDGSVVATNGELADRLDAQIDQVAANALIALETAGAAPDQVVRSVIYVVSDDGRTLAEAWRRFNQSALAGAFTTASTLSALRSSATPVNSSKLTSRQSWLEPAGGRSPSGYRHP